MFELKENYLVCPAEYLQIYNDPYARTQFDRLFSLCFHVRDHRDGHEDIWTRRIYDLKGNDLGHQYAGKYTLNRVLTDIDLNSIIKQPALALGAIRSTRTKLDSNDYVYELGSFISDRFKFRWMPDLLSKGINPTMHESKHMSRSDRVNVLKYRLEYLPPDIASVIVFDDLSTTGATMEAITKAVDAVNITGKNVSVYGITLARHERSKYWEPKGRLSLISNSHISPEISSYWDDCIDEYIKAF